MNISFQYISYVADILSILSFFLVIRVNKKVSSVLDRKALKNNIADIQSTLDGYLTIYKNNPLLLDTQEIIDALSQIKASYSNSFHFKTKLYFTFLFLITIRWEKKPHPALLIHCLSTLKSILRKEAEL